jgi:hypothetical protein
MTHSRHNEIQTMLESMKTTKDKQRYEHYQAISLPVTGTSLFRSMVQQRGYIKMKEFFSMTNHEAHNTLPPKTCTIDRLITIPEDVNKVIHPGMPWLPQMRVWVHEFSPVNE